MKNTELSTTEKSGTVTEAQLISYMDTMGLTNKLTSNEKTTFLTIAKSFGLNPFKREIYCVKYKENDPVTIITGYETYIKRAERSGQLDGWSVITEGKVDDNSLKAVLTIHRKDRKIPFVHEVLYSEYVQTKAEYAGGQPTGKKVPNQFWQKAHTMTKKVAIAQGFRLCFSDEMGGMPYTADEIPETVEITHTEVKESTSPSVDAKVMTPTPQPTIDNHVHAVNGIKKAKTFDELRSYTERTTLEVMSHPAVVDQITSFMASMLKASMNVTTLQSVWTDIGTIGKAKEYQANPGIIKIKDEMKLSFTAPAPTV